MGQMTHAFTARSQLYSTVETALQAAEQDEDSGNVIGLRSHNLRQLYAIPKRVAELEAFMARDWHRFANFEAVLH